MLTINSSKIHVMLSLAIITLFATFGMLSLFHPGLFTAHDIYHQVVRLHYYYQAVLDGQTPPYWIMQLANGHGYPLFIFSYNLPWIFSLPFLLSGIPLYASLKISFFLGFLFSGFSMYYLCKTIFKNELAAITSSILYLWAPYHFLMVFVGASIGVLYSFIFLPLLILGIYLCFLKSSKGILVLSVAVTGTVLSHLLHVVFFFPTIGIFILFLIFFYNSKPAILFLGFKNVFLSLFLALNITTFYLIPALIYSDLTHAKTESGFATLYQRNFIRFDQLVYSKWGYGPIINNAKNGEMSFQLGIAQWLCLSILILLVVLKRKKMRYKTLSFFVFIGFIVNTILLLDYSQPFWELIKKIVVIDFPFRFILPLLFICSLSSAIIIANLSKNIAKIFAFFIIIIALYANRNHIKVNLYTELPLKDYLDSITEITTNTFHEYTPLTGNRKLINISNTPLINKSILISNIKQTTNSLSFNITATESAAISIKQFNFPGLEAYADGKKIQTNSDENGLISINVTKNIHDIKIVFKQTSLMTWSIIISIAGLGLWVTLFIITFRRKKAYPDKPQLM